MLEEDLDLVGLRFVFLDLDDGGGEAGGVADVVVAVVAEGAAPSSAEDGAAAVVVVVPTSSTVGSDAIAAAAAAAASVANTAAAPVAVDSPAVAILRASASARRKFAPCGWVCANRSLQQDSKNKTKNRSISIEWMWLVAVWLREKGVGSVCGECKGIDGTAASTFPRVLAGAGKQEDSSGEKRKRRESGGVKSGKKEKKTSGGGVCANTWHVNSYSTLMRFLQPVLQRFAV